MERRKSEYEEQRAVIQWAEVMQGRHPELALLLHIPNEGKRSFRQMQALKSIGLRKGVPDLLLPVARGVYHGLWIEMKAKNGKTTKEQEGWMEALRKQGYVATVCYGAENAIECLKWYLLD